MTGKRIHSVTPTVNEAEIQSSEIKQQEIHWNFQTYTYAELRYKTWKKELW
jgi:hypothetical protein